jgi:hypothetical protein
MTLHSSNGNSNIISHNAQTIVASHCVGFTFPGIIEDLIFWDNYFSNSGRGPEANIRTSFAILFNETASCFKAHVFLL